MFITTRVCVFLYIVLLTVFTTEHVEGACPNDNTPVIDLCESTPFSGLGAYLDAAGMATGSSTCSCSVISTASQDIFYTSMLIGQRRSCQYYNYNILLTLDNSVKSWTCANPGGYFFASDVLDTKSPWVVSIAKTQLGLLSAPVEDPGYCLLLVAVNNEPINIVCGNVTSTSTAATTPPTAVTSSTLGNSVQTGNIETTSQVQTSSVTVTTQSGVTTTPVTSIETTTPDTTPAAASVTSSSLSDTTTSLRVTSQSADTTTPGVATTTPGDTGITTSLPDDTTPFSGVSSEMTTSSSATTTQQTPARYVDNGTDTGVGIIVGGIFAAVLFFFLVAVSCYFYNRYARKKEQESDNHSVITSTTDATGYPYRQSGDRHVYYLDTSAVSNKDYVYLRS